MTSWVVGIDLGGTKTAFGLINPDNEIVAHERIPTDADKGPEYIVDRIDEVIKQMETQIPQGEKVSAVGICAPGPLDHITGTIINPTNLPKYYNTPLRQMMEDKLGIPVVLEHDAKAAALGEMHFGAGRGFDSLVYIVCGTGVGAAIIMNGEIIRGEKNYAGEMGHITIDRNGEICPCGSKGCVDTYTSGPWLAKRYMRSYKSEGETPKITGGDVARMAADGDPLSRKIINEAGEAMGIAIATLAMILDVELYIIGGSVVRAGDIFLEPCRQTAPKYSFISVGPRIKVQAAELGENGAILGAGWLARGRLESA